MPSQYYYPTLAAGAYIALSLALWRRAVTVHWPSLLGLGASSEQLVAAITGGQVAAVLEVLGASSVQVVVAVLEVAVG